MLTQVPVTTKHYLSTRHRVSVYISHYLSHHFVCFLIPDPRTNPPGHITSVLSLLYSLPDPPTLPPDPPTPYPLLRCTLTVCWSWSATVMQAQHSSTPSQLMQIQPVLVMSSIERLQTPQYWKHSLIQSTLALTCIPSRVFSLPPGSTSVTITTMMIW